MTKNFTLKFFQLLFLLLCSTSFSFAQVGEVRGFLYDTRTGEPVLFTNVYLKGTSIGRPTDVNGYFSLSKIPVGTYTLMVTSLGYDTIQEKVTIESGKIINKKLYLKEQTRQLKEVEIKTTKAKIARTNSVNTGITRITPKEIKLIPPMGGEPDIAQYMQSIPGVVFTGDQGGQLFIRGGTPVQTLTLLDGMMIYNPFHSIGLFSVFDTDIIKNADIYTGGFPSEYGGRASAVIDIKTNDGNKNRLGGKLTTNPFTSKILVEGPLSKGKNGTGSTFIFSHRNSYLDRSSKVLYQYANRENKGLPFNFNDTYGKLTFHAGNGSKIGFTGFNHEDNAALGTGAKYGWKSYGFGTTFILVPPANSVLIGGNVAFSRYDSRIKEVSAPERKSSVSNFNLNLDFTYLKNKDEIKYGVMVNSNTTDFASTKPDLTKVTEEKSNLELSGYFKYKMIFNRLILDPGMRLHYYGSFGQVSYEPRFGAKYNLTETIRIKGVTGIFSQNLISTQSDRDVVNLFTGYLSSPDDVYNKNVSVTSQQPVNTRLQKAIHYVAGIEVDVTNDLEIDVEPYVKDFVNFININRDQVFTNQPQYINERGLARGVDFLAKWDKEPFFVQLGYSFSKITRKFDGIEYFPVFDRRHNLNMISSYKFGSNKDFEIDFRWNLGSGFPFTQTQAFYEDLNFMGNLNGTISQPNGNLGIYYGKLNDFNKGRLPYYHRLDFAIKKKFEFNENSKLEVVFSATNAYDRRNLFYFDRVSYRRVNQLPFLPAVGLNWTF